MTVDVRVIAATNRSVQAALDGKLLRHDLFYRLNVFHLDLPPLRHRKEDLPLLVDSLVRDFNEKHDARVAEVHPDLLARLMGHSWPGNIRELKNVLERAVIVAGEGTLLPHHLPPGFHLPRDFETSPCALPEGNSITFQAGRRLSEVEQAYIELTLKFTKNNKKRASEVLGMSVRTLHSWLAAAAGRAVPTKRAKTAAAGAVSAQRPA
jgi:DNA-binding NtrC family response regulator